MKAFKFIQLSESGVHFKSGDGAGMLTGHAAITGNLDEGGDIILPGAFKESNEEFLKAGWMAHSHDWGVDGVIGYLTEAKEDDTGLYVESVFHSTPDAQAVRIKAQERLAAGKQVGLSIGYSIAESKWIDAKDYEKELPIHVKAEHLEDAKTKASKFHRIRLLSKVDNFEFSIVTAPMNRKAGAASVKSISDISVSELSLDEHSEVVVSALDEFAQNSVALKDALETWLKRSKDKQEYRTKEGRTISQATANKITTAKAQIDDAVPALGAVSAALASLLDMAAPKEKGVQEVLALYAQFEQMRTRALMAH